jgi:hypothetical protein
MRRDARAIALVLGLGLLGACAGPLDDEPEAATAAAAAGGDSAGVERFALDLSHWEGPMSQWEMDCFWGEGVRHIIAGTQVEEVTRQQLGMAVSRGMTVDAYVYLYWNEDLGAQVRRALARVQGTPVGRLWLDVEESPGGRSAREVADLLHRAVDACRAQARVRCGIYTRGSYWRERLGNTTRFADLPLWYALYNHRTSLSSWSSERFGGWIAATGKQWAEEAICGVGADKNTMQVSAAPSVVVDRRVAPDDGRPPAAPRGLYPANGSSTRLSYLEMMIATVPRATSHEFELQSWNGSAWSPYYTWSATRPFRRISPAYLNRIYRFRARARNGHGWGAWSPWSQFEFGSYTGTRPGAAPSPGTPPAAPTEAGPAVRLSCRAVSGASRYEFTIEYGTTRFAPYYAYSTTVPSKTFYPQYRGTGYRWRVRAQAGGAWGGWSRWAVFRFP